MSTTVQASELRNVYNPSSKKTADNAWEETWIENSRRVSTPLAAQMLEQMGISASTTAPFRLLENACGAGVVAPFLQRIIQPDVLRQSSIVCGDFSDKMVGLAEGRIQREGWINTKALRVDAQKLDFEDDTFTHVATNLGFHVVPDSEAALDEAMRVLQPGGILGFTTFHCHPSWFRDVKAAFQSFPFEAPCSMELQTTSWGQWSDINWVRETLVNKGLCNVKVSVFAHLSDVDGPEDFITRYGMMVDWIVDSCWSEELRREYPREVVHRMVKEFLEKRRDVANDLALAYATQDQLYALFLLVAWENHDYMHGNGAPLYSPDR
ncbi:hypothetical protein VTJ49DRAFT_5493 [Mycothermus thermophilus]|uniref:Methyltransferase domain-containing protein n=1 Tax=Humicola insolens TaxID=85995 RepID=A0ABR3VKA4_HUMIN